MNYADMTVKELRELAAERGVKAEAPGNKAQLVIALEEADKAAEAPQEPEEPEEAQEGAGTSQEPEEAQEGAEPKPDEPEPESEPEAACYKTYGGTEHSGRPADAREDPLRNGALHSGVPGACAGAISESGKPHRSDGGHGEGHA